MSAHSAGTCRHSIVVTLSTGGTITLETTSALAGSLSVTAGSHGDSILKYTSAAGAPHKPPATPMAAMHLSTPDTSWVPSLHG